MLPVQSLIIGAKQSAKRGVATGLGEGEAAVSVVVSGLKGSSFRSLQLMTGGMFNDTIVEFLVHLFNGRLISALMRLCGFGKVSRSMGYDEEEVGAVASAPRSRYDVDRVAVMI